jgi:hypothetical protein
VRRTSGGSDHGSRSGGHLRSRKNPSEMDYAELIRRTGGPAGRVRDYWVAMVFVVILYISMPFVIIASILLLLSWIFGH